MTDKPQFLGGPARHRDIELEYPVAVAGVEYRAIRVARLTAGEVAAWQKEIADAPDGVRVRLPAIRAADGGPIPPAVLDALDADDMARVDEAAMSFMPRRFQAVMASGSGPADGGNTGPSSAA